MARTAKPREAEYELMVSRAYSRWRRSPCVQQLLIELKIGRRKPDLVVFDTQNGVFNIIEVKRSRHHIKEGAMQVSNFQQLALGTPEFAERLIVGFLRKLAASNSKLRRSTIIAILDLLKSGKIRTGWWLALPEAQFGAIDVAEICRDHYGIGFLRIKKDGKCREYPPGARLHRHEWKPKLQTHEVWPQKAATALVRA